MVNKLQSLVDLEKIDIEIARLENSKEEFPRTVSKMEDELKEKKDVLSGIERSITEQETGLFAAENSLKESTEGLDHSHARLNDVKTNREYDAVLLEINERKDMIERARKKKIKFSEKLTSYQEKKEVAQEEYDTRATEKQPLIDDLNVQIASVDDDVAKVAKNRVELLAAIPKSYQSIYNVISEKRKSGRVLAAIHQDSAACSYCFQRLNPNIKKKVEVSTSPVMCENCGSIFVWSPLPKEKKEIEE